MFRSECAFYRRAKLCSAEGSALPASMEMVGALLQKQEERGAAAFPLMVLNCIFILSRSCRPANMI